MTRDLLSWYKREQREVEGLPTGLSVRLTLRFTQEELRLLADGGVKIALPVLRRWIRDEVVATHLDGLRAEDEFWRSTSRVVYSGSSDVGSSLDSRARASPPSEGLGSDTLGSDLEHKTRRR